MADGIGLTASLGVVAAGFAVIYGVAFTGRDPSWSKTLVKTASVASLALAAPGFGAPALICIGLGLGALGDFFLSRPGTRAFLAGMAAFAAGHLAYAAQFLTPGNAPPLPAVVALLLLALSTELWLAPRTGALRWPVRAYVAVITLMAIAALTLPSGGRTALWGALLFLLSDLLLALDLFVISNDVAKRILGPALWAAYWGGQALILKGMLPVSSL